QKEAAWKNRRSGAFSKWLQQHRNKQSDQQRLIAHSGARAASPSSFQLWEQQRQFKFQGELLFLRIELPIQHPLAGKLGLDRGVVGEPEDFADPRAKRDAG